MSLTNCPECNKQISDLAKICPNCGYPINENIEAGKKDEIVTKKKKVSYILGIFIVVCLVAILGAIISTKVIGNKNLEKADNAVVKIICFDCLGNEICTGSGFFYKNDKTIVTNYHVIEGAYSANIVTNDDVAFEIAQVMYASEEMDLAVLKMAESTGYPHLDSGNRSYAKKGNKIYAIGSPLGIKNTLSEGIISGIISESGMEVIQFTAPISSGSSGGALCDKQGKVIGVTFASYENGQNLNLAIPIELVDMLYNTDGVQLSLSQFNQVEHDSSKLEFYDENIVFVIGGYGDYYYSCIELLDMAEDTSQRPIVYWAFNEDLAISMGYKEGDFGEGTSGISFGEYTENVFKRLTFYEANIVFVIEGYGDYYYTYDEMMDVIGDNEFTFWAYDEKQAISIGYEKAY